MIKDPKEFAKQVRIDVAKILNRTNDSHIGGGYSSIDIMSVLYTKILNLDKDDLNNPNRDVFILSKGHIAASMYTVLAHAGIIPFEDLYKHCENGENYAGHTRRYVVPGIEASAGSLGHNFSLGLGTAYAKRIKNYDGRVFVLLGDGECNEGSVWESAMFGSRFNLNNLVVIVDRNMLQSYGSDEQVLNMGDMAEKFRAFGWNTLDIDGHNYDEIYDALKEETSKNSDKPIAVIAHTVKGKGVTFMENKLEWHFKSPNDEQLKIALEELK